MRKLLICAAFLAGCVNHGPDYAQEWAHAPVPTSVVDRREECQRVRVAIADERARGNAALAMNGNNVMIAAVIQRKEGERQAYLEDRASQLNCTAAFSSAPAPTPTALPNVNIHLNFDQCFAKCKSLTSRGDEQCFDICK